MNFWPFHTHKFKLMEKTYVPPAGPHEYVTDLYGTGHKEKHTFGFTTLIFQCSECTSLKSMIVLGKSLRTIEGVGIDEPALRQAGR